jgi:hypothetical protein
VTHDVLRDRLPDYVAGRLCPEDVERVRAHLAGGCDECMRRAFGRAGRVVAPVGQAPERRARRVRAILVGVAVAGALGAGGWALRRDAEAARERRAAQARIEVLAGRLAGLEEEIARAGATAAATQAEHAAIAARAAYLEAELLAGSARLDEALEALRRAQVTRAPADRLVAEAARALAGPDARLATLEPVSPYRDVRGHGVWRAGGKRLLVFALDLPPLPGGEGYRVELRDEQGRRRAAASLVRGPRGQARATVPLNDDPARLSVQVVRDRVGAPVLAGRLGPQVR